MCLTSTDTEVNWDIFELWSMYKKMETDKLATLVPNPKTVSFFLHQDEARVQIDFLLNPHEDDKMYYKTR